MPNDYSDYDVNPVSESVKQEMIFKLTAFKTTGKYTSFQAFAVKLQDLLLMEPGTQPDAIGMGCGIKNYLMELLDENTIAEMNALVERQIKTYLPNDVVKKVEFIKNGREGDRNKVYLFIYVNKEDEAFTANYFAIGFGNDASKTRETVSSIYM